MGFRRDIEKIIAFVPKERQTLLFSATVPEEVSLIFVSHTLPFSTLYDLIFKKKTITVRSVKFLMLQ